MTAGLKRIEAKEHVLLRPDMYIGSVESETSKEWVATADNKLVYKEIKYVPGLYKIFDEIITNASDNKQRDATRGRHAQMKYIKVNFEKSPSDENKVYISVENDGIEGFLAYRADEQCYTPELAFGYLMTSTNYDDNEERVTGGRNGFGAKLTNIYSKEFYVELVENGQKYEQNWGPNMENVSKPKITTISDKKLNYIKIKFLPDYQKFKLTTLDESNEQLLRRRVFDIAGCNTNISVTLNGQVLPIHNFKQYVQQLFCAASPNRVAEHEEEEKFIENVTEATAPTTTTTTTTTKKSAQKHWTDKYIAYFEPTDRWSIAIFASERKEFQQISFVNSIYTMTGGNHVELMIDLLLPMINDCVKAYLRKNDVKSAKDLTRAQVKQNLFIIIRSLVVNPSFDSQTKIFLKTPKGVMKSAIQAGDFERQWKAFTKDVSNLDNLMAMYAAMINTTLQKVLAKTDGAKTRFLNIEKLEDAVYAGTEKSDKCFLYLTEGDSAKTTVVEGISKIKDGRLFNGIFPLRGKVLNVRDCPADKVKDNKEITNIKKILGLRQDVDYSQPQNRKQLRYGHVVIMTDQDTDGSHIKGLLLNMFDTYWPSLLRSGYVQQFITPIIKVMPPGNRRNQEPINFYTVPEYEQWLSTCDNPKQYSTAYYKGLGTSSKAEVHEYFQQIDTHKKQFSFDGTASTRLNVAFNKKMANNRKEWLRNCDPNTYLDTKPEKITISDFVNKELVLYELDAIKRAIPSMIDGLKPSQRKILYGCFKRRLTTKIKVAQLSGYVAEHSAYHHGEGSLATAIVGLAQSFTGANNIAYLVPAGQFGSRSGGGKDSAAPRYIFTYLQPIMRYIYIKEDESVLREQQEDNQIIEPEYYVPIIPMILINGANGIGTGWSTTVPQFNPLDIVKALRKRLYGRETRTERYGKYQLTPWYCGWEGNIDPVYYDIQNLKIEKWLFKGVVDVDDKKVTITELPPMMWTNDFLEDLKGMASDNQTKAQKAAGDAQERPAGRLAKLKFAKLENRSTNDKVEIAFTLDSNDKYVKDEQDVIQALNLQTTIRVNNMMLHDENNKLKQYESPSAILDEFYEVRLKYYQLRKQDMLVKLAEEALVASECARFIKLVNQGIIKIQNVPIAQLCEQLWQNQFMPQQMDRLKMLKGHQLDQIASVEGDDNSDDEANRADIRETEKNLRKTVKDVVDPKTFFASVKKPETQALQKVYQYLTKLALYNLTAERMKRLIDEAAACEARVQKLRNTEIKDMWAYELAAFELAYKQYAVHDEINKNAGSKSKSTEKLTECAQITVAEKSIQQRLEEAKNEIMALPPASSDDAVEPQLIMKTKAPKEPKEPKVKKEKQQKDEKPEKLPKQTKVKIETNKNEEKKVIKPKKEKETNSSAEPLQNQVKPKKPAILGKMSAAAAAVSEQKVEKPKNNKKEDFSDYSSEDETDYQESSDIDQSDSYGESDDQEDSSDDL